MDEDIAQSIAGVQCTVIGVWFVMDSTDLIGSVVGGLLIVAGSYLVAKNVAPSFRNT